jgi:hypothetical protein
VKSRGGGNVVVSRRRSSSRGYRSPTPMTLITHGEMPPSGDTPPAGVLIASWNCICRPATCGPLNRKLVATARNITIKREAKAMVHCVITAIGPLGRTRSSKFKIVGTRPTTNLEVSLEHITNEPLSAALSPHSGSSLACAVQRSLPLSLFLTLSSGARRSSVRIGQISGLQKSSISLHLQSRKLA